jgi:MoaA/NifB/PqqE/SkfB family radical SAM enzyme
MAIAMFSELPKLIEIEPTLTCNLRCKMCHVSYEATESRSTFPAELTEKLAGLGGVDILLGSNYEPRIPGDCTFAHSPWFAH